MAMNSSTLATDIVARWIAEPKCGLVTPESPVLSDIQRDRIQAQANAIAAAVVAHIATFAVVTVASVSGVTVGSGISGPGAGSIT